MAMRSPLVRPREIHHLEGKHLGAEVGLVVKRDGQVDLPERVCLRPQDHAVEGRAHWAELQLGDVHGVEGVNVEDVEAAASVH